MSSIAVRAAITLVTANTMLFAVPPYFWYATHSIENYSANGACGRTNLWLAHNDADGFNLAVQGHTISNKSYAYNRRDTECTAARWSGTYAENNNADFLFYSGHGWARGPYLGCNTGYPINSWESIRFGESGYLKWVQTMSCQWFVDINNDGSGTGMTEFQRWNPCFRGVHTVQAHKANTYEMPYNDEMSDEFFDLWVDQGYSIWYSWKQSQIHWVYQVGNAPGLVPTAAASTWAYAYETWADASDAKGPNGIAIIVYGSVGTPEY